MNERRELAAAVVACGVGAGLVLAAAGQPWVHAGVDLPSPLPRMSYALSGRELAPLASSLGLAGLAGLAGLVATRGYTRAVVGVLLAVFGVASLIDTVDGVRGDAVHRVLATKAVLGHGGAVSSDLTAWWAVCLVGALLLLAAGAFTAVRGRAWPGLSRRYDAPGGPSPEEPRDAGGMWESIDRGKDPTLR